MKFNIGDILVDKNTLRKYIITDISPNEYETEYRIDYGYRYWFEESEISQYFLTLAEIRKFKLQKINDQNSNI